MAVFRYTICHGNPFRLIKKIMEALIHQQPGSDCPAAFHPFLHQPFRCDLSGGVIGIAHNHQVGFRCYRIPKGFGNGKAIFFPQGKPDNGTACQCSCLFIFRKSRRWEQDLFRL